MVSHPASIAAGRWRTRPNVVQWAPAHIPPDP
jgi:hypothetical protein